MIMRVKRITIQSYMNNGKQNCAFNSDLHSLFSLFYQLNILLHYAYAFDKEQLLNIFVTYDDDESPCKHDT